MPDLLDQLAPPRPAMPDGADGTIVVDALGIADGTTTLNAPTWWHDRIRAIEPYLRFGPDFSRGAWEHLDDMSRFAGWGDFTTAERHLGAAEAHAARAAARSEATTKE